MMVIGYQSSALPRSRQSWAQRRLRVPPAKERAAGSSSASTSQTPTSNLLNRLAAPPPLKAFLLAERAQAGAQAAKSAALSISERGFCVCRGGLDDQIVANARCEIDALFRRGAMRPGGFTVAGRDDVVKKDRDDHTLWLNEYLHAVGGPQKGGAETVTALDGLISRFGEAVAVALSELDRPTEPMSRGADGGRLHYTGRTDSMLACYPGGGAAYGPHIDNLDGDGRETEDFGRCFTCVYYLNEPGWDAEVRGGALRLHLSPEGRRGGHIHDGWPRNLSVATTPHEVIDLNPSGDTLVIFRADRVLHEVRPAKAKRFAMTVWLYGGSHEQAAAIRR